MSRMSATKTWQASCLCGENVITWTGERMHLLHSPSFTIHNQLTSPAILKFKCHCTDERKLTGAAFALNMLFPYPSLSILKGQLSTYTKTVNSGNAMTNHSCGQCGSLLFRWSSGYPDVFTVKAGTIDGEDMSANFVPDVELFTRSRAPWEKAVEGAKQEVGDFTSLPEL